MAVPEGCPQMANGQSRSRHSSHRRSRYYRSGGTTARYRCSGIDHVHTGWARFLPDGLRLAVNGDVRGHGVRCYTVDLSNGTAKPVTPEGVLCGPSSPDSRSMTGTSAVIGPSQSIRLRVVLPGRFPFRQYLCGSAVGGRRYRSLLLSLRGIS